MSNITYKISFYIKWWIVLSCNNSMRFMQINIIDNTLHVTIVILIFHIKSQSLLFFKNSTKIVMLLSKIWPFGLMYISLTLHKHSGFTSILNKICDIFLCFNSNIYMMHLFGKFMSLSNM